MKKDIEVLLQMERDPASRLFEKVKKIERQKLGEFDVWPSRIQRKLLLKCIHMSDEDIRKEIEREKEMLEKGAKKAPCDLEKQGA